MAKLGPTERPLLFFDHVAIISAILATKNGTREPGDLEGAEGLRMEEPRSPCNHHQKLRFLFRKYRERTAGLIWPAGGIAALLVVWALWRIWCSNSALENANSQILATAEISAEAYLRGGTGGGGGGGAYDRCSDAARGESISGEEEEEEEEEEDLYGDPQVRYTIGKPIQNWDRRRRQWLARHPGVKNYTEGGRPRIFMVTGSQPGPCSNPIGDHLLLRFFKNKVDYCRLHGLDIFYNTVLLEPHMTTFWAKIPLVRAAMVAHPEAEWIWWMDSDAAITDMDFHIPLERYRNHNLVVHGWEHLVYQKRSWVSLNAGIFLMRNCQWSMEFLERWSAMGPQSPLYGPSGKLLSDALSDRAFKDSDDQSALVYLLLREKDAWADKIFLENSYNLHGYWIEIVGSYENISRGFESLEEAHPLLRRRHAEKMHAAYARMREPLAEKKLPPGERRPFVTHFTGCQPCSGDHNKIYEGESCWKGMEMALNFADDQVLRNYGFRHDSLRSSGVSPVP